jgi:2-polyprenyl-6-methoxyphenol hydroxylase-like FAD-dependent oxidoreductase
VLPHTGQGAAQAIEDAVALGTALGPVERLDDVERALRAYETARASRTRRFVTVGPRIARVTTTHNRAIQFLRSAAIRLIPTRLLANS